MGRLRGMLRIFTATHGTAPCAVLPPFGGGAAFSVRRSRGCWESAEMGAQGPARSSAG